MGKHIGPGFKSSQSVVTTNTIESIAPNTQYPEEGRMNILLRDFCRNQCRVLQQQLSLAEEILKNGSSMPSNASVSSLTADIFWPQSALKELHRVLTVGRTLIEGCHVEHCLKAYLRQGERTLAFSELLEEITWCMSVVLYYNSKDCMPGSPSIDMDEFPVAKLRACKELCMLQKAALNDQKELLSSLEVWIQSHVCGVKECGMPEQHQGDGSLCVAAQIWKRRHSNDGGAPLALFHDVEPDHASGLWITAQEALEDVRKIGNGSFGTVFETTWLGATYAKKEFIMNPKSFDDEVNALARLNHPHIVKVSARNVAQGSEATCFFLMDIMPQDLRTFMREKMNRNRNSPPFEIFAAIDLMLQISEAMSYIHSQGLVHRDLKPENILVKLIDDPELCKQGFVFAKLVDFGLAKSKREVTVYSHMTKDQGTSLWRAPEVFKANADDDERLEVAYPRKADVWSFGVVCSEILTGKYPFHNVDFKRGELYKLLTDPNKPLRPELPESCPESLASLICNCWNIDPRRRPKFIQISTMLRYLKGLLMLTGDSQLEPWMETKLRSLLNVQLKHELCIKQAVSNVMGPPHSLFYTTFDGSSWTTAVPVPHRMVSPNGMSLADHHGMLVGVHRGQEQLKHSRQLYWNIYTRSSWTHATKITSQTSPSRPAVATFRDRLYCLYRGEDNEIWCTSAGSNLNDGWTRAVNAGGSVRTSDGPALASYGDCLISVIRGVDNYVYWGTFNGSAWRGYIEMNSAGLTSGSPALAVYKNELYCCIRGMDGNLHWGRFLGARWSSFIKLVDINLVLSLAPPSPFSKISLCAPWKVLTIRCTSPPSMDCAGAKSERSPFSPPVQESKAFAPSIPNCSASTEPGLYR